MTKESAGIKNTGRCRRLLDIHAIRADNVRGGEEGEGSENRGRKRAVPTVIVLSRLHKHQLYWFASLPEWSTVVLA